MSSLSHLVCLYLLFSFSFFIFTNGEESIEEVIEIDTTREEEASSFLGSSVKTEKPVRKNLYEGMSDFFTKPKCTHSEDTPLLGVVMIVKNEAKGMKHTIQSFKDYIDWWTILDTGSTDGTQQIIKEELKEVPGNLFEEPFIDFSTSKNRALELHGTSSVFTIFLHGDETIVDPQGLVDFLRERKDYKGGNENCYYISYQNPSTSYFMERIGRTGCGWGFHGPTHEAYIDLFEKYHAIVKLPTSIMIYHDTSGRTSASLKRRWELDLDLLLKELERDPTSERWTYYLGQTYHALEDYESAYQVFDKRVKMGGWQEEVFYSMYMRAFSAWDMGRPWSEVLNLFLQSHAHSAHRVEPIYIIAKKYWSEEKYNLCYLFASYGSSIPYPHNYILFIERELYAWRLHDVVSSCAYYVGKYEEGKDSTIKALLNVPEGPNKERLRDNLHLYESAIEYYKNNVDNQ